MPKTAPDTVATYTATDPEGASITWDLLGDDNSFFSISTLGVLTFEAAPDFEARADADHDNEYLVTVRASDGDNIVTLAVTVTVTDENEPPAFAAETDTRTIAENTGAGENIGTPVSATDPDAGDTLTYSLSETDAASFDIDTSSGQLKTKAALDKEAENSYTVTVSVRDSKDESGVVDLATDNTITVAITVTDANEAPEFPSTENGSRSIAENTPAGQNIGAPVAATDPDADATLTYSLSDDG